MSDNNAELLELTTSVVAAYVSNNNVQPSHLVELIGSTYSALANLGADSHRRAGSGRADPQIGHARRDYLPGRRQEIRIAESSHQHGLRPDARAISHEVGAAGRLPDGRTRLCRSALRARQVDGAGPQGCGRLRAEAGTSRENGASQSIGLILSATIGGRRGAPGPSLICQPVAAVCEGVAPQIASLAAFPSA